MRRRKPICGECSHTRGSHRLDGRGLHEGMCIHCGCEKFASPSRTGLPTAPEPRDLKRGPRSVRKTAAYLKPRMRRRSYGCPNYPHAVCTRYPHLGFQVKRRRA